MDSGGIISFFKKFDIWRLIWSGILLRVFAAIIDGIFNLGIREIPAFNYYIFALALTYTIVWMFNESYEEED
ncbi:MAG: hypothetical protein EVA29_02070 [Candidatus Actinomarinales bacterium]|nr:MAG: hypothetical protein EVA29_02070 [Candidatus Actinomarinales bacterium]|tara:strand:- start:268 stop:483 length:216 start_codon:yes stop_codon:yes gene_type:complete